MAAFLRMDCIEDLSYPMSFAFTLLKVIFPIFLYYFIGQLVADARVGDDYFTFVVIGLAVAAMMQGAMAGFGGSLQRAFMRGTLETLLVEPVPWTFLPIAMNLWQGILGIISGVTILIAGLALGASFVPSGIPAFLLLTALGIVASTGVGILSAALLMLTLKSQPVLAVYTMAASLLAGSVFSVSQLPEWLQWMAWLIPQTYVINGARTVLMEDPGSFSIPVGTAIVALVIFNMVVFPIGVILFRRSLEYARKMGLLSGY